MSLFDTISQSLSKRATTIGNGLSGSAAGGALLNKAVGKFAPRAYNTARALQRGDFAGAALSGLNAIRDKLGIASPLWNPHIADLYFQATRNPLLGGITPEEAARIAAEVQGTQYSKKNLFFIEIRDWNPPAGSNDISHAFNLFATDAAFGPWTISSEAKPIGMGVMDTVTGTERTDLRITTYDDTNGTIKAWFDAKCSRIAHPDGTIGVPADYLVGINIIQSAINDEAMAAFGGYKSEFIMRPASLDIELSRSEDGLQQIQLSFNQFDTFMFQGP